MSLKQIDRRLLRLEVSTGANIPNQVEEVFGHWAETGKFGLADGSPVPIAVFDEVMRRVGDAESTATVEGAGTSDTSNHAPNS